MEQLFYRLKNQLIVSCQASGESPFNSPAGVTMLAKSAKLGGAAAIRSEGIEKTKMIIGEVGLPVIGLIKSEFEDGTVRITGRTEDAESLIRIGCGIIAVDGTSREREFLSGPRFISKLKKEMKCLVMADISTFEEASACADAGADCISTTLSGYTPHTSAKEGDGPDFILLEKCAKNLDIPVFAEGRIKTPEDAARMLKLGAWSVVVGTAITRPNIVTGWYLNAMKAAIGAD